MNKQIYIFTHEFPYTGGEPYMEDEYQYYSDIDVQYVPGRPGDEKLADVHVIRIPVAKVETRHRIQAIKLYAREFNMQAGGLYLKRLRYNLALLAKNFALAEQLSNELPLNEHSTLYTYWFDDLALLARAIKKINPKVRWISRAHGFDVYEEQSDDNYLFFKKPKLQEIDGLYVVSQNGAAYLRKQFPGYSGKVRQAYLGCEKMGNNPKNENSDELHVATCAVVRDIKRLDRLFGILPQLNYKKVIWHVIGDGPDLAKLKNFSALHSDKLECVFYGSKTREEIKDIYSTQPIDVFVSVSRTEGLPMSIMEAMSAGIPALSTDAGGCREIVKQGSGQLIPVDFKDEDVVELLNEWKSKDLRQNAEKIWDEQFNAQKNYMQFRENF